MSRITVLGSGAWGTAIALSLAAQSRHSVTLWSHRAQSAEALDAARENLRFLPGFPFPASLHVSSIDEEAVSEAEILVFAVPSEYLRSTVLRLGPLLGGHPILVSATKGIEGLETEAAGKTYLRMSQVIEDCLTETIGNRAGEIPVGSLSGPSFAKEVAAGMPTAVTIAFRQPHAAAVVQREFSSSTLRLYTSDDLTGVELGGALKNVIAIASGIVSGLGLGSNSAAALITRGIAEITRLAVAAGGRRETLSGLSGVGDLVLTCTGLLSRNRTVGFELGQGRKLPEILAKLEGKVAEGIRTTSAALGLSRSLKVEMPITQQMEQILHEGKDPRTAIRELMQRPAREEED